MSGPDNPSIAQAGEWAATFPGADFALFTLGRDGRFLSVSEALGRLLGALPADLAGRDALPLLASEASDRAALAAALAGGPPLRALVCRSSRPDGKEVFLALTTGAGSGQAALGGMAQDVTFLASAERDYRGMFENAGEGIYRSLPNGRQIRCNPALAQLNGYADEAEQIAAVNDIASEWYVDPMRREEFKSIIERDGKVTNFESEVYRHKTRERIWISENARVVRDEQGKVLFYEGTVRDITTRKQTEARLADFLEVGSDWLWETDAEHNFVALSEGVARVGVQPRNVVGMRRLDPKSLIDPDDPAVAEHRETVRARLPFRDFRYGLLTAAGGRLHLSTSGKPIFDAAGTFTGYRGAARDISDILANEHRLREALAAAEVANAAKDRFLANMSHELRTPLNAIIGFSEVMRDELLGPMREPRYLGYARDIHDSATVLLQLIQDILDISKAEAGKLELDEEEVDIGELAGQAFRLLKQRAGQDGVTLHSAVPAGLPRLRADGRRIRQVVVNLVSNAVKFTPSGGSVTLSAALLPDGGLRIEVADTGIGIPADMIETVFRPFVQLATGSARRHEGTGLGLPLCRKLVELHGGSIRLEPANPGTRAVIELPAERTLQPPPRAAMPAGRCG